METDDYHRILRGRPWRTLRARYLGQHPLCEDCLAKDPDRTTLATEVHHIVPLGTVRSYDEMKRLAYDWNNLRALCPECHQERHLELNSWSFGKAKALRDAKITAFAKDWLGLDEDTIGRG